MNSKQTHSKLYDGQLLKHVKTFKNYVKFVKMLFESPAAAVSYVLVPVLVILYLVSRRKNQLNLPGPKGWPFVGNALQMKQCGRGDETMEMWARKYGGIYSIQMFNMTWVVLSGFDELYEALVQKAKIFSGRYRWFRFSWFVFGNKNIGLGDPTFPHWMPMRKAMHRTIQPRGNNLNRVETVLIDMAQQFVNTVKAYNGKVIDLQKDIYNFVSKVTVTVIIGENLDDKDPLLLQLKDLERLLREVNSPISGMELDFFPWLRHFGHPIWKKMHELADNRDKLWDRLWEIGIANYSTDDDPQCVIHAMAQLFDKKSQFYEPSVTQQHARAMLLDVVGASIVTTSNSAYALINQLLHNPHIYKKMQAESDAVLGQERAPNIFDRDNMPYTVATINELLRIHSILPTLVPHATLEDTTVAGHKLPAGTTILPLACFIHHDKNFWGDPEVFRPERFLDESGKLLSPDHPNRKHLMPFGMGARECIGEVFANRRLFIFVASIVQAFDLAPGDVMVSCDPKDYEEGWLLAQKPFTARLIPRNI